jgi:hypothetical protein
MMITERQAFYSMLYYVNEDSSLDTDTWDVVGILGCISMERFKYWHDSPTSDPAAWFDWVDAIEETEKQYPDLVKNLDQENLEQENVSIELMTREQGLVAVSCFFEKNYFKINPEWNLREIYLGLKSEVDSYHNIQELMASELWGKWMEAVKEGKKSKIVFKEMTPEMIARREKEEQEDVERYRKYKVRKRLIFGAWILMPVFMVSLIYLGSFADFRVESFV